MKKNVCKIVLSRNKSTKTALCAFCSFIKVNVIPFFFILMSPAVFSACINCNQVVELSINQQLSSANNVIGKKEKSSSFTTQSVNLDFGGVSYKSLSFTDIYGNTPPNNTLNRSEVYQKVDDYFSIAVYYTWACGTFYLPENRPLMSSSSCQEIKGGDTVVPKRYQASIRIDRKLVGGTYAKRIFLGRYGACNGRGCVNPTKTIANVYLNYNITVPENCVLNAGEVITVDFGTIPSTAFNSPGKRADRVNPVTRQLTMQCTNIEPFRNMSVRVQANSVSGNAIVSNNKDVGFVLGDSNRRELTPNQPTSTIPFTLSGTNTASVPVTIWPVSITGKTPEEGRVNAIGFLRVDFD
ncbi:fimbrial protein [Serratia ureilytica]|uniref:fimbrial protein n=1 Tax=Serratia ureilytica TaxID=300181 RepID=UPI0018A72BC8|nr:fimbrial protein [Serratia ureilytica]MBF4185550.1 fimbrial protein [Serratia ureilytica]MBF8443044.1 fimbrial protein [Serratia ureilytica]MBF8447875.1 fimbrial protein [Serratia ureilytica]